MVVLLARSGQRRGYGVGLGDLPERRRFLGRRGSLYDEGSFAGRGACAVGFRAVAARSKVYRQTDSGGSIIRRWRHCEINKQDGAPEIRRRANFFTCCSSSCFTGLDRAAVFTCSSFKANVTLSCPRTIACGIKRVPGTRGMIYDRQGQLLVDSRPSFDLIFVPEDSQGTGARPCACSPLPQSG